MTYKKYIIYIITLLLFSLTLGSNYEVVRDENGKWVYKEIEEKVIFYNNVPYGSKIEDVTNIIGNSYFSITNDRLAYYSRLSGKNIILNFRFYDNLLYKVEHIFLDRFTDTDNYFLNFYNLKNSLISFYGKPKVDEYIYSNSLRVQQRNLALENNQLILFTKWILDDIHISLMLYKEKDKIVMKLLHYPKYNFDLIEIYEIIPII